MENWNTEFLEELEKWKMVWDILDHQMSDQDRAAALWWMDDEAQNFIIDTLSDQKWRLENLYFIVNEEWEKLQFDPNFIQREIMSEILDSDDDYIRHIILKYRQGWVSTFFTILLLDEFLFGWRNIYNVIIAHERKLLISLFMKIRFALENIEDEFKPFIPKMDKNNANELYIIDDNNRLAISLNVRWETPTRLHLTELAWREVKEQQKIITSINPFRKTKITIESTANWVWDTFYNITMAARVWKWNYKLLFYPWYIEERNRTEIPFWYWLSEKEIEEVRKTGEKSYRLDLTDKEAQIKKQFKLDDEQVYWRRKQIEDALSIWEDWAKIFDQENPDSIDTAFVASGTQVFDLWLTYLIETPEKEIWDFKIFWTPEDSMVFWIDTAEGWKTSDYSTIIWMSRSWKVLVTFRKRCQDFQLAEAMDQIFSLKHKWKYFVWTIQVERNKWTGFVIESKKYDWFYLILKWRDVTATKEDNIKEYYWFWTGGWSKELIIRDFRKAIYNKKVQITQQIYTEISTYIYNKWKAEAMSWKHDDMIMAAMIAYNWILYENWVETYEEVKIDRSWETAVETFDRKLMSWNYDETEYDEWDDQYN